MPEKSKDVFAAILLGSEYDFPEHMTSQSLVGRAVYEYAWSGLSPFGLLLEMAREAANFAASLFYNSIFRVSKWFFFSQIPTCLKTCA